MNLNPTPWLESPDGQETPIRGACFIGRSTTSSLVLSDDRVSRRHAMIQAQGANEFWLIDLGSANGTYLNGRRIVQAHRLSNKDEIKIGGFSLVFHRPRETGYHTELTTRTEKTVQEIKTLDCWLLVADIEHSTEFIKHLPAEEAPRITGRWLSDCKQIVEDHQGVLNKFLGDGFLGYWVDQTQTVASVAAALNVFKEFQGREQPRFRIVVHYGSVVMGGTASLGEELMGSEVNFVFRMEKLAGSLSMLRLLSQPAFGRLKSIVSGTDVGKHPLHSFEGKFSFFSF